MSGPIFRRTLNLNGRQSNNWDQEPLFDGAAYTNNRRSGWGYDADGRNNTIGTRTYNYDADGQMILMTGQKWVINHYVNTSQAIGYDGDGDKVREVLAGQATYYLRSSVLANAIIAEINSSGQKNVGYVYAEGQLLAKQTTGQYGSLLWKHTTAAGTSHFETSANSSSFNRIELDPMGADIGLEAPNPPDTNGGEGDLGGSHTGGIMDSRWSNFFDLSGGCSAGGVAASCSGNQSPDAYMQAQMRELFGDGWYDLPGHNNERARGEEDYERRLAYTRGRNGIVPSTREGYLRGTKPTDCSEFVDTLMGFGPGGGIGQTNSGRLLARWAGNEMRQTAAGNPTHVPTGFKAKYIAGGQNLYAMVHIAGVGGATLIGGNVLDPYFGTTYHGATTGTELVAAQFKEDRDQLALGLLRQHSGLTTTGGHSLRSQDIHGYPPTYPLNKYIAEKRAEISDDEAGVTVGHTLADVFSGHKSEAQARNELISLLCGTARR